ncbi:conserved hypothetical protein [Methylobacterium sp. 4-46]|uniref:hypothetical protein n=1 Tax=unclassified Methylobacterium TaxID=2615210 RepID=UPI000165C791|nr:MULTISPECIES: hypothetical protein [Methylobacterium]ACA16865.1 conserved hypothetical protein [Methylobacterium sp. 4-46]WFT82555.1 hypothetical protein QA634_12195 [Methylobacterium nodulans]
MRCYNLFRLKEPDGLICAVPEDYAVPAFVTGSRWVFDGKVDGAGRHPFGFDRHAAATAVRFNGFYLFQRMEGAGT